MLGIAVLILIFLPLLFQIIIGRKAIAESISLDFGTVSCISFLLQIFLSIISLYLASYNFNKYFEENPSLFKCGMPLMGVIMLSLIATFLLLIVIIVQYFIKRSYED